MPNNIHKRIELWNKERGFTTFNADVEVLMLSEEIAECTEATTLAHKLQEFADVLFVLRGTLFKFRMSHFQSFRAMEHAHETMKTIAAWVQCSLDDLESTIRPMLPPAVPFSEVVDATLELVTIANEAKPAKTKNGKGIKGDNCVSPLGPIKAMLKDIYGVESCILKNTY
jgi:hypothetical protein